MAARSHSDSDGEPLELYSNVIMGERKSGQTHLGRKVDHVGHSALSQEQLQEVGIADVALKKAKEWPSLARVIAQVSSPSGLQSRVIVVVEVVKADERDSLLVQPLRRVVAHKAGHPGEQDNSLTAWPKLSGERTELGAHPPWCGRVVLGDGSVMPPQHQQCECAAKRCRAARAAEHAAHADTASSKLLAFARPVKVFLLS
eukprot:scaffold320114_cov35-Tisochrysis_lutea.AAC.1